MSISARRNAGRTLGSARVACITQTRAGIEGAGWGTESPTFQPKRNATKGAPMARQENATAPASAPAAPAVTIKGSR